MGRETRWRDRPRSSVWSWNLSNLYVYPLFVAVAAWGLSGIYLAAAVEGGAGSRSLSVLWALLSLAVAVKASMGRVRGVVV
jgi:hypothetical protein